MCLQVYWQAVTDRTVCQEDAPRGEDLLKLDLALFKLLRRLIVQRLGRRKLQERSHEARVSAEDALR